MTHPDPRDNPHTGVDENGNPVTLHVIPAVITVAGVGPDGSEGGEQPSRSQEQDGTEPSASSSTAETSEKSGGTPSPRLVPSAESQSGQDLTTPSTANGATGSGTAPQTALTRLSDQPE